MMRELVLVMRRKKRGRLEAVMADRHVLPLVLLSGHRKRAVKLDGLRVPMLMMMLMLLRE